MRAYASVAALALMAGSATAALAQDPAVAPTAAAMASDADDAAPYDPLEKLNRAIWGVNMGVDKVVLKPASTVYRTVTPRPARRGLTRVLANLSEPYSVVNNLLQGKADRAFNSLGRFVINMTAGVGGLADQASRIGLRPTPEDFGLTLAHWGVKAGPYIVLPLLGPSTVRDGIGSGVSFYLDPYRIGLRQSGLSSTVRLGENAFEVVSARSDLTDSGGDTFLKTSLDSYAAARSAFLQRRQLAILDRDDDGGSMSAPAEAPSTDDPSVKAALDELKTEQGAAGAAPPTPRRRRLPRLRRRPRPRRGPRTDHRSQKGLSMTKLALPLLIAGALSVAACSAKTEADASATTNDAGADINATAAAAISDVDAAASAAGNTVENAAGATGNAMENAGDAIEGTARNAM